MHATNKQTLNGRFTKDQMEIIDYKVLKWIYRKLYKYKKGSKKRDYRGQQITYGHVSRKFKISYTQARYCLTRLVAQGFLKKWRKPVDNSGDKSGKLWISKGDFYQWRGENG